MILAFSFIGALFVTMVLVPLLMRAAEPMHLLDIPNGRKIHTEPVPRCGGLAIASAFSACNSAVISLASNCSPPVPNKAGGTIAKGCELAECGH